MEMFLTFEEKLILFFLVFAIGSEVKAFCLVKRIQFAKF